MVECYSDNDVPSDLGGAGSFAIYGYADAYSERCHIIDCHSNFSGHYGAEIYRYSKGCSVEGGSYLNSYTAGISTNAFDGGVNTNFNVVITGVTTMTTIYRTGASKRGLDCVGANILATGCSFYNHTMGVMVSALGQNCTITGNHMYNSTGSGIRVFTGNHMYNSTGSGIRVLGDFNIVTDNWIRMFSTSAGQGIEMGGDHNLITGNIITHSRYGFFFGADSEYNTITGNGVYDVISHCCYFSHLPVSPSS